MPARTLLALWLFTLAPAGAGPLLDQQFATAGDNAPALRAFISDAAAGFGSFGEKAAVFLVEGMPERDLKSLGTEFLIGNLSLALKARAEFHWARDLPEDLFFNDVLPYASLDEAREPWRGEFHDQCGKLVAGCTTATEAAQTLNREFFKLLNVHYNTGRKAPNQSPSESRKIGMATCTGLAIILVDACRAVGVPARVAGTPMWTNKRGNHTWVEIHDRGEWFFTGADEYDQNGLNRAWFTGDASKALAHDPQHAIWATSWKATGSHFPTAWNPGDQSVPGVNVTARYTAAPPAAAGVVATTGAQRRWTKSTTSSLNSNDATVHLRAWDKPAGERLALAVDLLDAAGIKLQSVTTNAGATDLNDMPAVTLPAGEDHLLMIANGGRQISVPLRIEQAGETTKELVWSELEQLDAGLQPVRDWLALPPDQRLHSIPQTALTNDQARLAARLLWETLASESAPAFKQELDAKTVKAAGMEMRWLERSFGDAPAGRRSLWISMHGGGGAPAGVNDGQWRNQIRLYQPQEGIVVAPRAPTDTWNLWHQPHIDDLFDRLIAGFVTVRGVDPGRIYLMGYSAGGDGVYQLAPRMADRFAAAAMMAGHPNDASPLGLRNLPFMIFAGGDDAAYNRNQVAAQWGAQLDTLQQEDPRGYPHKTTIYQGLGHWMNGNDAEALPWMAAYRRTPWPKAVVWHQAGRTHERFYWLAVPAGAARPGQTVRARVDGQRIEIQAGELDQLILRLNDRLLDLDQAVLVAVNGVTRFDGKVQRMLPVMWKSLQQRMDPATIATAEITLQLKPQPKPADG